MIRRLEDSCSHHEFAPALWALGSCLLFIPPVRVARWEKAGEILVSKLAIKDGSCVWR